MRNFEPRFTIAGVFIALMIIPSMAALLIETRLFQGENPWIKLVKFEFSLAVYLLTLAWFAQFLPKGMTERRGYRIYVWIVLFAIAAELIWIGNGARLAIASHFNETTLMQEIIYASMGIAAITLTSVTLVYGVAIWRAHDGIMTRAIAIGLILTFVLTLITAGTLSQNGGHFVGTPVSGAKFPLMGWSREVGDLRVAHFWATHAMQIVPLTVYMFKRWLANPVGLTLVTLGYAALTLGAFVQGLMGYPFL